MFPHTSTNVGTTFALLQTTVLTFFFTARRPVVLRSTRSTRTTLDLLLVVLTLSRSLVSLYCVSSCSPYTHISLTLPYTNTQLRRDPYNPLGELCRVPTSYPSHQHTPAHTQYPSPCYSTYSSSLFSYSRVFFGIYAHVFFRLASMPRRLVLKVYTRTHTTPTTQHTILECVLLLLEYMSYRPVNS